MDLPKITTNSSRTDPRDNTVHVHIIKSTRPTANRLQKVSVSPSILPTSFFKLNSNSSSLRNYTRRCLRRRHPLCGSWVTSWMYIIGDRSLTLSPRKPSLKPKITFFFFLKKEAPFTFMTTEVKPIFLADRPTCSATASEAYRERRDRPFLSSKQPAEAPVFLFPLESVTVTKVFFLFSKTWTKSLFFLEYCSCSLVKAREELNGKPSLKLKGFSPLAVLDLYVKPQ